MRDNNTGLVWEQAPDITGGPSSTGTRIWGQATFYCVNKNVGGTVGWRLPSVVELRSVQDPSSPAPLVPTSVFTNVSTVQSAAYWSATTDATNPAFAWVVFFGSGNVVPFDKLSTFSRVWCVRGGMNADAY